MSEYIIIDGIYGQDGSFLAKHLLENDETNIIGITRRSGSGTSWRHDYLGITDKIKVEFIDILEKNAISNIIKKYQPKEYYHLAAQSFVKSSFDNVYSTVEPNIIGTLNILEAIRHYSPKTRMYNASSSEMYGRVLESPQSETTPYNPVSPYGCFPKGTKISIKRKGKGRYGEVNKLSIDSIENIKIGDFVLSFNEKTHKKEYDEVINTFNRESDLLYKIKFSNGNEILCTEEHPIYLTSKTWKEAKDLQIGDECVQLLYTGLSFRLNTLFRKGKTYTEIFGEDRAEEVKDKSRASFKESIETGAYIPWALGKTKETCSGLAKISKKLFGSKRKNKYFLSEETKNKMKGKIPWNKDLKWEDIYSEEEILERKERLYGGNSPAKREEVKNSISQTVKDLWNNNEYIKKQLDARGKKNKLEIKIENILNELFPNEFEYNGRYDKNIMIGRKIPDFVNTNNKNKVIEAFGTYWHSKEGKMSESDLKAHYQNYGYDCLVIWDSELSDIESLKNKIKTFYFNPNIKLVKVVSIEKIQEPRQVFNITTKNNHNYFAFGILVHNCSKLASHELVRVYRESYGLFVCSGILFNHESQIRGIEFITKKLTNGISNWYRTGKTVQVGNLNAKRDWGHSSDYVEAMVLMLHNKEPKDYVVATGKMYSIREFIVKCLNILGVKYKNINKGTMDEKFIDSKGNIIVEVSEEFYRPNEVNLLLGNSKKIRKELGWEPKHDIDSLVQCMMDYEFDV